MKIHKLSSLLNNVDIIEHTGLKNPDIHGVAYDSGKVQKDFLFTAIKGFHTDGHGFIPDAVKKGAAAIVYSDSSGMVKNGHISLIKVRDSRKALSRIASNFYGRPSEKLKVIGVTGTDGKSTTVWFIHQLLEMTGRKSGFLSTVNFKTGDVIVKNRMRQSTPESLEIHAMFSEMVENGINYAVVESTSHGLSERTARLFDVDFDVGVLTNITHEHLEFHGTREQYRYDKANLFRKAAMFNIVNLDDPDNYYFKDASGVPVYSYSAEGQNADIYATEPETSLHASTFNIHYNGESGRTLLNLPGKFNISNVLASSLTVLKLFKLKLDAVIPLIPKIRGVQGRMEEAEAGQPFRVIIDYAHTPESFKLVLPVLKTNTRGKLIAVFGSAGERDTEKRSIQGKIAAEYCDKIILTDEDPRGEDREQILSEIAYGVKKQEEYRGNYSSKNLFLIPDRKKAIEYAFSHAEAGDTVVLLGKGHEGSIIYNGYSIDWDEKEIALGILKTMGFA
ncbi:MAG: UDP-N-acetylmuramoyl-L-alanyl-D-glutamate--2,6-diaminopimelate ligase [Spirochaetes bacterium]|nr:UDP-N-acetylmuramoyl-L-alanyl-D-glutamate--2,6-diaminopimelate ligase [Spirochaetota bacterium]